MLLTILFFFHSLDGILLIAEIHEHSNPFPKHLTITYILLNVFPLIWEISKFLNSFIIKHNFQISDYHDYTSLEEQFLPISRFPLLPSIPILHLKDVLFFVDICLHMWTHSMYAVREIKALFTGKSVLHYFFLGNEQ